MSMTAAEAKVELAILDSNAQEFDRVDAFTRFTNAGLPQEVVQRLQELWDAREEIAGRVVHVGKIIFMEINRFLDENPNLAFGVALGAGVGALASMIPLIGPLLAPFVLAAGILIGAVKGYELDAGVTVSDALSRISQEIIIIARKFFDLLARIFNALRSPAQTATAGSAA
jgi:hypothetical protein